MEQDKDPIKFGDFFTASQALFKFILINPYELFIRPPATTARRVLNAVTYWLTFSSSALVIIQQTIYLAFLTTRTEDIVKIIGSAAWIPVSMIAFEATFFTWRHGPRMTRLIAVLESTYPKTKEEQEYGNVRDTFDKWNRLSWIVCRCYFLALYIIFFQNFSLAVLGHFLYGKWELKLPRLLSYPFDTQSSVWMRILVYIFECWGTMTTTRAVVTIGVFLGSVCLHICIQFDVLTRQFRELEPTGNESAALDLRRLISLVQKHNYLIDICNELSSIFRASLLVNYVLSSVVIGCFGFLILNEPVLAQKTEYFFDFVCFMSYNSLFSFYGDSLMDRVSRVELKWGCVIYNPSLDARAINSDLLLLPLLVPWNNPIDIPEQLVTGGH